MERAALSLYLAGRLTGGALALSVRVPIEGTTNLPTEA